MAGESLIEVVRAVLAEVPCSERALARAAGLSSAMLPRIRGGSGRVTTDTARRLAAALEDWSKDCARASRRLRHAIERSVSERSKS
jgi:hypothetical protein